jgi:hypothetical protein
MTQETSKQSYICGPLLRSRLLLIAEHLLRENVERQWSERKKGYEALKETNLR